MNVMKNLPHSMYSLLKTTKFNHQIKGQKKACPALLPDGLFCTMS